MRTCAILKKNLKTDRQNHRTNDKSTDIQTQSHKEAYKYTLTKIEKGKNIQIGRAHV